ncbi:hypothetical protein GJAV_G00141540 [Gymnothorax javanicus]|nr:hypothetical protein GJAV_G00141540 [Gymnothorax javanicus]
MADGVMPYPQVFTVDRPLGAPPCGPTARPRHPVLLQTFILLVCLAFCGLAVEAYFIYQLYNQPTEGPVLKLKNFKDERQERVNPTVRNRVSPKPVKNSAHLTDLHLPVEPDGVLQWGLNGDAFTGGVEHKDGSLQVKKEGLYFIYSKVSFADLTCSVFKHTVAVRTPRYSRDLELMKALRFSCSHDSNQPEDGRLNSYLGGVFHLHTRDSVLVKVQNHTLVRHQETSDNFFGMFMI